MNQETREALADHIEKNAEFSVSVGCGLLMHGLLLAAMAGYLVAWWCAPIVVALSWGSGHVGKWIGRRVMGP